MLELETRFLDPSAPKPILLDPRSFIAKDITYRQVQCLIWVQEGKSAADIGAILGLSGRTVEGHLHRLCKTLGVTTRLQAVLEAQKNGLFSRSTGNSTCPDE